MLPVAIGVLVLCGGNRGAIGEVHQLLLKVLIGCPVSRSLLAAVHGLHPAGVHLK